MQQNELFDILKLVADFAILNIGSDGLVESATPQVRAILKKNEGEVEGKSLADMIPELEMLSMMEFEPIEARGGLVMMHDDEECLTSDCLYLEYLAAHEQETGSYELQTLVEGSERWLKLSTYKLMHEDKIVFVVLLSNITKRKKTEIEIKQLNENLELRVQERTAELSEKTEQIKKVVKSCGKELEKVNAKYQAMKEQQMEIMEGMAERVTATIPELSEESRSVIHHVINEQLMRSMDLYTQDQITDQKFLLTMLQLKELFEHSDQGAKNLQTQEFADSENTQNEVDDLLASLGF